jgi:hypothetical protein
VTCSAFVARVACDVLSDVASMWRLQRTRRQVAGELQTQRAACHHHVTHRRWRAVGHSDIFKT